jgi:hypothetical protein
MAPRKTTNKAEKPAEKRTTKRVTKAAPIVPAKPRKPIFGIGTWVSLLLLAVMVGVVVYLNQQEKPEPDTSAMEDEFGFVIETVAPLFEEEKLVTGIEIVPADGVPVGVARDGESAWVLTKPEQAEADPGMAEAAASQAATLEFVTEIENASDLSVFGLDAPSYIIKLEFEDGSTRTLEIGDATPSSSGYYARMDGQKVVIVGIDGIQALLSLVDFPPYLNLPTPTPEPTSTPLPTETPAPSAEATPTP